MKPDDLNKFKKLVLQWQDNELATLNQITQPASSQQNIELLSVCNAINNCWRELRDAILEIEP